MIEDDDDDDDVQSISHEWFKINLVNIQALFTMVEIIVVSQVVI